jgi:hypothetical protein
VTSGSIEASDGFSKGTITATLVSKFAEIALSFSYNRNCTLARQGHEAVDISQRVCACLQMRRMVFAGTGPD